MYDLIILGAGNAGLAAAETARRENKRVLVVEARDPGGTCPLRGCVPKKVLVAAAEVLDQIHKARSHGIHVSSPKLDWNKLISRKHSFVEGVPDEVAQEVSALGAELRYGTARFVDHGLLEVDGEKVRAPRIIVATGARPAPLAIEGAEHVLTSEDLLEMRSLPPSLLFVGAGVVAFEIGHVLARAGVDVAMLEMEARPLRDFDADAVSELVDYSRKLGIDLTTAAKATRIEASEGRYTIHFERDGQGLQRRSATVAHGAGRVPAIEALDLRAGGVDVDDAGNPRIDEWLRSRSNPSVLFAGDVIAGTPQLSPVATYEGKIAAHNALHDEAPRTPSYLAIPRVVFTVPALAGVGSTEEEARAEGRTFSARTAEMTDWRSSKTHAESVAYAKILVEQDSDRILGAHLVGHGAQEVIHTFGRAIQRGITASELKDTVYAYPTFHADIRHML